MTATNPLPLNQGQKNASEAFFEFLLDPDAKEFHISGPAGVGKTFLMSYIIDNTMQHYFKSCELLGMEPEYTDVMMTATTNKAAEVLGKSVNRPTSTIHSFLNLRVTDDFKTGKSILSRTRDWMVHRKLIIFIDECSMIDSDLYEILHEGTEKCKIVYVGDHNQLAPIYEKISPIYKKNAPFFELTEQMRNSNQPALMAICAQLRETVETGVFKPIKVVPGVIDLLDNDQMVQKLIDTFVPGPNLDSRILAYTNKTVIAFNDHVRNERNLPTLFTVGEILVNNSAVKVGTVQLSVEQELTVHQDNGTKVVQITPEYQITVQDLTVSTTFGDLVYGCRVPTDRDHYADLMKWFANRKNWERYYYLKNNFADLRPRDAATVHKSQGSTYDSVFLDLDDMSKVTNPEVASRLLYVAFSRAKSHIYMYGNLTSRFGGLEY